MQTMVQPTQTKVFRKQTFVELFAPTINLLGYFTLESTPLNKLAVADDARAYIPVDGLNMTLCQMKSCKSVENKFFDQKKKNDINHNI